MANYIEVGTVDQILTSSTPIEVGVTVEQVTVRSEYNELGLNNRYVLSPYSSISSMDFTIPGSVTAGLQDIDSLKSSILSQLSGNDVAAIIDTSYQSNFNYNPELGTTVRDQLYQDLDVKYLSNGPDGDAHILGLDYRAANINTVYDSIGTVMYENAQLLDVMNDVVATKAGQASVLDVTQAISNWNNSYSTTIENLNTTYGSLVVEVTDVKYAFAGNPDVVEWYSRNDVTLEGIMIAKGGDISYNPSSTVWYQYIGGAFGVLQDGWIPYEGTTAAEAASGNASLYEQATAPLTPNVFDIWVDTSSVSTFAAERKMVLEYKGYDATGVNLAWVEIDPDKPSAGWAGGASKLIVDPTTGGITGWSAANGSGIDSSFKINADNFSITNAIGTDTPFTVINDPVTGPRSKFVGLVEFAGLDLDSDSTVISGDKIRSGNIDSNTEGGGLPISRMDLDGGQLVIRDSLGRLRVKLGFLG
jgi:hypothetical protein